VNKIIENKKGATFATVVIVVTVLILLSSIIMDAVLTNFVLTKRHMNIDFAYYAGESAIENWMSVIQSNISGIAATYPDNVVPTNEDSRNRFGEFIVNKIESSNLLKELWIDVANKSDALVAASPVTTSAKVNVVKVECEKTYWEDSMMDEIDIYISIKSKSSFSLPDTPYTTGNKEVYAVKPFRVKYPVKNYLESAIWSVGDFYIRGNQKEKTAVVKGDVFTFGSYAENVNDMDQQLFGGIYAIDGGKLKVYGNAYSRSFVRTGPYITDFGVDNIDKSEILVYKDIIAQCIQIFADKNRIIGLRNAYTFDDIEVNGEDSFIAINGSYFGLTKGGIDSNHDDSSAIVNSAIIHSLLRRGSISLDPFDLSDAFKSRIVINGDVIVGGSTMKIDTEGEEGERPSVLGPIENASLAYNKPNDIPQYRLHDDWSIDGINEYHRKLRQDSQVSDRIKGFLNQFQVWDIIDPFNPAEITQWINRINNERQTYDSFGNYTLFGGTVRDKIKGWWSYEIVGNDKVYKNFLPELGDLTYNYTSDNLFVNQDGKLGFYRLDNIYDSDDKIKYGKDTWNFVYEDGYTEHDFGERLFGTAIAVDRGKCGEIKDALENKVNLFVTRKYAEPRWNVSPTEEFDKILKGLKDRADMALSNVAANRHILYIDNGYVATDVVRDVKDLFSSIKSIPDIYEVCRNDRVAVESDTKDDKYYIIANADPNLHLQVSGEFNGIIVTAGKVYLKDNASVYGSIIAAGDGDYVEVFDEDGGSEFKFYPKARAVSLGQVNRLNNGEFAAVIINNEDGPASAPYVDFYLGMAGNESQYNKADLLEVINYAVTKNGYFLPAGVVSNEEKLLYLNRAARVNLLQKFLDNEEDGVGWSINLYDIF